MNYIRLINQFWKLRRSKRITSKQADLYFFLIQECNEQNWENPFECSNKIIIASIDITEPTLVDARNRLKQLGLIDFRSGKRNEASPFYQVLYLNNLSRNRGEPLDESMDEPELNDVPIKQTKPKKTKPKGESADAPPAKTFKNWTEQEFIEEIGKFKDQFSYEIRNAFYKYWKERSPSGKMKFQLQKTWETDLRLSKWQLNDEKFKINGNKINSGSAQKPVPEPVGEGGFGQL